MNFPWLYCLLAHWHKFEAFLFTFPPFLLAGYAFGNTKRFRSSYAASLARRSDELSDAAYLKELYHRNEPEAVIRVFESQPSLHSNPTALAEYVKALVKVDRLDESELLKTLQRG